jgi:hypothetical protein
MLVPKINPNPNHKPVGKYDSVLQALLNSITKRDGVDSVRILQGRLKCKIQEGMHREAICQILAKETAPHRNRFLVLHPELIIPYFIRLKNPK